MNISRENAMELISKKTHRIFGTKKFRILVSRIPFYLILLLTSFVTVYPFFFMFTTSLKDTLSIYSTAIQIIPTTITGENYKFLFTQVPFLRWMLNTLIVAGIFGVANFFSQSLSAL
jgi:ABC-type glycerol-3-phosphate transport system permease component